VFRDFDYPHVYLGVEGIYATGTAAMQFVAGMTALSPATAYSFPVICE
jgi:hypothetical protein